MYKNADYKKWMTCKLACSSTVLQFGAVILAIIALLF